MSHEEVYGLREDARAGDRGPMETVDLSNINRLLVLDQAKGYLVNAPVGACAIIQKQEGGEYKLYTGDKANIIL